MQQEVNNLLNQNNDEILTTLFGKVEQYQIPFCRLFLQSCKSDNNVKHG